VECSAKTPPTSLRLKGVGKVLECLDGETAILNPLEDLRTLLGTLVLKYISVAEPRVEFSENETIGDNYILYKYHVFDGDAFVASCRAVLLSKRLLSVVCTVDSSQESRLATEGVEPGREPVLQRTVSPRSNPRGQRYIDDFIIYRILGSPVVDASSWKLKVEGLVERPLALSLSDVLSLPRVTLVRDFHCVTGWSVASVRWEGVRLRLLADMAGVTEGARWVYMEGLDGYSSVVPVEDFLSDDALLVLAINGRPLTREQGFPARIFIPHLYGWKGVKWVHRIEFRESYVDGFWEALGYHERGNVFLEERFKMSSSLR